jgi:hypothetical protein
MERLKVVIVLLLCAGMASAASFNAASGGGEWDDTNTWYEAGFPTAADAVYLVYNSSPVIVSAGQVEACSYTYGSMYTGYGGGSIDVDGQLDMGWGLFLGNWSAASAPTTDFVMNIGDAGVVNLGSYGIYTTGLGQSNTQVFNINGGLLNVDAGLTLLGTQAAMTVSGDGLLDVAGGLVSGDLTIDIVGLDATVVIASGTAATLISQGDLLANGVVGDAGDFLVTDLGGGLEQITLVPEPATMVLLGLGALVLHRKK